MARDSDMKGVPHRPDVKTVKMAVTHPETGEEHSIHVPADHDGSRIKVELGRDAAGVPVYAYTEGWDPAERAMAATRPVVPCGNCGSLQPLTDTEFVCSACGTRQRIELKTSGEQSSGAESAGRPGE